MITITDNLRRRKLLGMMMRTVVPTIIVLPQLTSDQRHRLAVELSQARTYRREHPDRYPPRPLAPYYRRQYEARIEHLRANATIPPM